MSNPTISTPSSQKRWPISTIFTPEKKHAIFMPLSSWPSYCIRHPYHTTFVPSIVPQSSPFFIPLSFSQNFSTTCQSANSKNPHISNLSHPSHLSHLSHLSQDSHPSHLSHASPPSHASLPTPPSHNHAVLETIAKQESPFGRCMVPSGKRPRRGLPFTNRSSPDRAA